MGANAHIYTWSYPGFKLVINIKRGYPNEHLQKVYMDAQAACGLKAGDYVRVVRKAEDKESGWGCDWDPAMDKYVGETGIIEEIFANYIRIVFPGNWWCFPYFVLEKVERPVRQFKPFDKVLVRDTDDDKWVPAFFGYQDKSSENYQYKTAGGMGYKNCIPYEGNEHLCGTSDPAE